MKCPVCEERDKVELSTHSEGYTSKETPVKECGHCGSIWTAKDGEVDIISRGTKPAATAA